MGMNVYAYACSCKYICLPSFLMVCNVGCDFNPPLLRQVHITIDSAMQAVANSRATTRNSIAIVLHAASTAAASSES